MSFCNVILYYISLKAATSESMISSDLREILKYATVSRPESTAVQHIGDILMLGQNIYMTSISAKAISTRLYFISLSFVNSG